MKKKWIFLLWFISLSATLFAQSAFRHKSEVEITRMTPAQRVIEFCEDHVKHGPHLRLGPNFSDQYSNYLRKALYDDGGKGISQIAKIINEFDPLKWQRGSDKEYQRFEAASSLLVDIDNQSFRIRSFEEGRNAITALKRAGDRMRKAYYKNDNPANYEMGRHFSLFSLDLAELTGFNRSDECVKNTLSIKYEIILSYSEQLEYINYLIEHHPKYPSSSEREHSKSGKRMCLYKKPEVFQQAYLAYKASKK